MVGAVEPLVGPQVDHPVIAREHEHGVAGQLLAPGPGGVVDGDQLTRQACEATSLHMAGGVRRVVPVRRRAGSSRRSAALLDRLQDSAV